MVSLELEKFVLNEGKKVLTRRYTVMLKRAEKELEWLTVNFPKAEMVIDQLRLVIQGFRSILATVAGLDSAKTAATITSLRPEPAEVKAPLSVEPGPGTTPPSKTLAKPETPKTNAPGKIGPDELQFIKDNYEHLSPNEIGRRLGVAGTTILYHLKKLGLRRGSLAEHAPGGGTGIYV